MRSIAAAVALLTCSLSACSEPEASQPAADPSWANELARFRADREKSIAGSDGWITLVGRFELKNGANTVGSNAGCAAVLPPDRAPALLGTLNVEAGTLSWTTAAGADVRVDGQPVASVSLRDDSHGDPTVLEAGTLQLHVIRRGDAFLLRAKDREHPARAAFQGIDWFAPDRAWRVRARLEPSPPGTTLPIVNVLGQAEDEDSPGQLVFSVDGDEQRLAALPGEDGGFFVIFKDRTAGESTYPAGRFLDTAPPDARGFVEIDFNRAYSPPCAFTAFATCPLPPRENFLDLKIEAGEKFASKH